MSDPKPMKTPINMRSVKPPKAMGRVHFTADTHFGHANLLTFQNPRPFATIEEHDRTIIESWNMLVRPGDQIWHLGDFAHKCHPRRMAEIFGQLNGLKCLIRGNHDTGATEDLPWAWQGDYAEIAVDGQRLILQHYAMRTWNAQRYGSIMLFGHSHGRMPGSARTMDVGVDSWSYCPVILPQIVSRMAELPMLKYSQGTPIDGLDDVEEDIEEDIEKDRDADEATVDTTIIRKL